MRGVFTYILPRLVEVGENQSIHQALSSFLLKINFNLGNNSTKSRFSTNKRMVAIPSPAHYPNTSSKNTGQWWLLMTYVLCNREYPHSDAQTRVTSKSLYCRLEYEILPKPSTCKGFWNNRAEQVRHHVVPFRRSQSGLWLTKINVPGRINM